MKRYQSVKKINLMSRRQSLFQPQSKKSLYRFQSNSRSSHKNINRDPPNNQIQQCLTDRQRYNKINQFSLIPQQSLQSPRQKQNYHTLSSSIFPISTIKSNIQTFIRFKPFTKQDFLNNSDSSGITGVDIINDKCVAVDQNMCYSFDKVFEPEADQISVYDATTKELIRSFTQGYNGTIFAYGQTGSGKTYTMFGNEENNNVGIIPIAIQDLFSSIQNMKNQYKRVVLQCSMCQIYKQAIYDLMTNDRQKQIKIKDSFNGNVQIQNLTVKQINSKLQLMNWINKGSQMRKIRGTQVNQRSSRSHLILTLYLNTQLNDAQSRVSKLNLVDLAGSQKVSKTKVSGQGLEQAIKINLSLSCLGNAIFALSRGQQHIPFRDSKLTRILQQSLSGNSITKVIVTCSMGLSCKNQTISSLKFANRIKKIKTSGSINLKKLNQQGVNKLMYQTLKTSYQNCQQKLQKIKFIIQGNSTIISKQQLIEQIRNIFKDQKQSTENQFLSMSYKPFETFRSPQKEYNMTESCDDHLVTLTKEENKLQQKVSYLSQHIKNLQKILVKQQKIIQSQTNQLQILRKNMKQQQNQSKFSNERQEKISAQKLKVLKLNNPASNIGSKIIQIKSKNKPGDANKNNIENKNEKISPFINKFEFSNKKSNRQNQQPLTKQRKNSQQKKQKSIFKQNIQKQYTNMEKQILDKQVRALAKHVQHLKKIIIDNGLDHTLNKAYNNAKDVQLDEISQLKTWQNNIKQKNQCQISKPNDNLDEMKKNMFKQQFNHNKKFKYQNRHLSSLASPASSRSISRISSTLFSKNT